MGSFQGTSNFQTDVNYTSNGGIENFRINNQISNRTVLRNKVFCRFKVKKDRNENPDLALYKEKNWKKIKKTVFVKIRQLLKNQKHSNVFLLYCLSKTKINAMLKC